MFRGVGGVRLGGERRFPSHAFFGGDLISRRFERQDRGAGGEVCATAVFAAPCCLAVLTVLTKVLCGYEIRQ